MKKFISLITALAILSTCVFAAPVKYTDPALMESTEEAFYEPYPIKSTATRYTPWLTMYHMQRKVDADKGLRGGEGGQMIMSAAVSPVNPNLVLFGTDMGGLWRSVDGGENWYSVTDNINMRAVMGIEFHPTKENLVYCIQSAKGTGLAKSLKNTSMDGLYRSKDGGRTWEQVLHALFLVNGASQELIQFDDNGNVYVLSREGVYKSTDDGENWKCIGTPDASTDVDNDENYEDSNDSEGNEVTVDTSTSGGVFALWVSGDGKTLVTATSTSGISLSTNGGTSWVSKNVSTNSTGAYSIAVDPKDTTHWYAIFTGESSRVYETKNSGTSWSAINSDYYADKNKAMVVKISYPGNGNTRRLHLVYTNAAHQYRYSDDNGTNWYRSDNIAAVNEDTFTQSTGYNTEALEICSSNPDIVFFSYGDVMYKSTNGGKTFFWSNAGYSGNYANGFVFDSKGRLWIPFTDRGMAVTDTAYSKGSYPTATKTTDNGTIGAVGIDPTNENNIYITKGGWSNQTLYKSTNGGSTWAVVKDSSGNAIQYTSACKVIKFHSDYANNGIIYAGKYKSSDFGKTWTALSYNIWDISPIDSNLLFSVSGKNVMFSIDAGATWSAIDTRYDETVFSAPRAIEADHFDKTVCWVTGYGGYVFRCTTAGGVTSYSNANGLTPLGDVTNSIDAIVQDPNDANHLIAGTNGPDGKTKTTGLYETYDGGKTWHVVKGLPSARNIQSLEFTPAGDEVLIGTCSQGTMIYDFNTYKKYLDGTLTVDKSDEILLESDADKYRVMVDGSTLSFAENETPYLANDEIYMPVKKLMEEAGYTVSLNGTAITASKDYVTYSISADSSTIVENGEEVTLSNATQLKNNILFAPQSFFNSCMDIEAEYDSTLRRVEMKLVPVLKITYSYGDSEASKTEYVKNGAEIKLEKELTRPGYEVSHWTDLSGNTYALGSTAVITENTTFTAVWKRSNNAKFMADNDNSYYPSDTVILTDTYDADAASYKYTVDYSAAYSGTYNLIADRVKIADTSKRDRKYAAYKFDLTKMGKINTAVIRLQGSQVKSGGYIRVYSGNGKWDTEFGTTGVNKGETETFSTKESFPSFSSNYVQSTVIKTGTTNVDRTIDISEFIKAEQDAGAKYAIIYVVYHLSNTDGTTTYNNGLRLYNMGASEALRPQLIVNEPTEIEVITKSGTIYAQADVEGKTGIPVIAYFKENENGVLVLQNAIIGEPVTDTTKKTSIDIEFAEGEKPVVKFFIWNGKDLLVPLMDSQSITIE
ncbi:MAG: hypothetical protein IJX50_02990 [Clostridia bacterium]|nr:hypothetical protein [Clostridia bacterium]